jgi:hypothetical protein
LKAADNADAKEPRQKGNEPANEKQEVYHERGRVVRVVHFCHALVATVAALNVNGAMFVGLTG